MAQPTLNNNQFSALVSLAYNIGLGNFASSTLLKKIKAQDFAGAADEFIKWDHVNHMEIAGLVARRAKEREIFLRPVTL
jgi:lysozyme